MNLKEIIQNDLNIALKEKQETKVSVLKLLKAVLLNKEKEKRYKKNEENLGLSEKELDLQSHLTDDEIIEIIFSEIKKRKEAILLFEKGGRKNLVEKEKNEIEFLEKYLPEQLSEDEIRKIAKEIIKKLDIKDIKNIGKVMGEIIPRIKGKANTSLVSKIIKELLL